MCSSDLVRSLGDSRVGLSGLAGLSANFYLSLLRHLDGRTPVDFTLRMNRIRMVQSPAEVRLSEAAVRLNEEITAGLHFTEELLKKIREKGVKTVYLTLHVGLGTFRPVKEDNIEDHVMHTEIYNVPKETVNVIKKAKESGNKIFAVGTTSVRTLESLSHSDTGFKAGYGDTNIFIYPGFEFKIVDVLITNFHLPKSTLLMLVSAFSDRGKVLNAYEEAKKNDYRFFSFGDAMLLI